MAEVSDRLRDVTLDIQSTSVILRHLDDLIEKDLKAPTRLFKDAALRHISGLAAQCDKVYKSVILLLDRAKRGSSDQKKSGTPEDISETETTPDLLVSKLDFGRSLKWP